MKHLKLYEDFDFNDDDFDFEEESPIDFEFGDVVVPTTPTTFRYWYNNSWYDLPDDFVRSIVAIEDTNDENMNISIRKQIQSCIHPDDNYNGYMMRLSGCSLNLWFKTDDFQYQKNLT